MSEVSLSEADISTAVIVFAHFLGIDLETEQELLPIAENALRNLPNGWELGIGDGDNAGIPYFFNESSGESVWQHPKEAVYKKKVKEEKKRIQLEQEDRKRNRKADNSSNNGRPQQRNSNDRNRDDTNRKSNNNDNFKGKGADVKSPGKGNEVIEVSDFFQDDDDDSVDNFKKSSSSNATGKKKETGGQVYGMSAADFLSEDEEEEEKVMSQATYAQKEAEKKHSTTASWNESNNRDKNAKSGHIGKTDSLSWDDDNDKNNKGTSNSSNLKDSNNNADKRGDSSGRGYDDANRGKDNRRHGESNEREEVKAKSPGRDARERNAERVAKEKEIRDRENKERENRDREAREKDLREKEKRDKERIKEREREAEVSSGIHSALAIELSSAKAANRDLEDRIADLRHRHLQELDILRASNSRLEEKLTDEKEGRRASEERLTKVLTDGDSRVRDSEEAADSRIRESQRKAKADADDDWKEKIKTIERRHSLEMEEVKIDTISAKKKLEECQLQLEATKRKMELSKEDAKLEGKVEADEAKATVKELEAQLRSLGAEFRKHRDDHGAMAGRLASALQTAQVAMAESEAAKAQAAGAMSEGQTSHSALIQATHRIQQLDLEVGQLKAELLLHRSQGEVEGGECRRLQNQNIILEESLKQSAADLKRLKATSQAESSRQNSRIAELDALNNVMRSQMDTALSTETTANRDTQRLLDKAEYEASRLRDRLVDVEAKAQAEAVRCISLEKESRTFEEIIFIRDRTVREERQKADEAEGRLQGLRTMHSEEILQVKKALQEEKALNGDLVRSHKAELADLKKDIAEKVPKIVSTAVERVESQLALRVEKEVSSAKIRYEHQTERVKQELLEFQGGQAEREARHRVTHAEEKAELDRLRHHSQRLQRRIDELEEEQEELKASRRRRVNGSTEWESQREREEERQWAKERDRDMGGQRARARPHTVPSRFSNRRDEDFVENNEDRDRDDEENSYYSDRGDDSHGDRGPLRENGSNSSTRGSGIKKRSNNNNSSSSSGAGSAAHRRQGGFDDRDRDRDSAEDTLAMQTMSLIHGQLTAMKHQLLTISDISKAPESDDASQSLNQGQGPPPPSQNSFFRKNTSGYSSSGSGIVDPGVLHASEQAIQRMFRPHQQQDSMRRTQTHPDASAGNSQNRGKYAGNQNEMSKVTFPPESLLFTPREKQMQMASSIYAASAGPHSASRDRDQSVLDNSLGSSNSTSVSLIRDREDIVGGGAGGISFQDTQDGGFHEGYWRAKYNTGGFGSPVPKGGGSNSSSVIRMR